MPAHIKASLLGPTLTLPLADGRPALGTWQGIYLCEHRDHGGPRSIVATAWGESPERLTARPPVPLGGGRQRRYLAPPDGRALLGERGRALLRVRRRRRSAPRSALTLERLATVASPRDSRRMRLLPASASGPLAAIVARQLERRVERGAGLADAVDEPELVAALGA